MINVLGVSKSAHTWPCKTQLILVEAGHTSVYLMDRLALFVVLVTIFMRSEEILNVTLTMILFKLSVVNVSLSRVLDKKL